MDDNSQRGENQSFEYYQARVKRSEIHLIPTKSHFSTSLLNGWFDSNNDGVICESVEIRRSYVSWGGRVAISAFGMRCCCGYLFLPSITWNSKYRQPDRTTTVCRRSLDQLIFVSQVVVHISLIVGSSLQSQICNVLIFVFVWRFLTGNWIRDWGTVRVAWMTISSKSNLIISLNK